MGFDPARTQLVEGAIPIKGILPPPDKIEPKVFGQMVISKVDRSLEFWRIEGRNVVWIRIFKVVVRPCAMGPQSIISGQKEGEPQTCTLGTDLVRSIGVKLVQMTVFVQKIEGRGNVYRTILGQDRAFRFYDHPIEDKVPVAAEVIICIDEYFVVDKAFITDFKGLHLFRFDIGHLGFNQEILGHRDGILKWGPDRKSVV